MAEELTGEAGKVESPPVAGRGIEDAGEEPRRRLASMAQELARTQNRRLMAEYLTLRRIVR
jgi:hypothetical protein